MAGFREIDEFFVLGVLDIEIGRFGALSDEFAEVQKTDAVGDNVRECKNRG